MRLFEKGVTCARFNFEANCLLKVKAPPTHLNLSAPTKEQPDNEAVAEGLLYSLKKETARSVHCKSQRRQSKTSTNFSTILSRRNKAPMKTFGGAILLLSGGFSSAFQPPSTSRILQTVRDALPSNFGNYRDLHSSAKRTYTR